VIRIARRDDVAGVLAICAPFVKGPPPPVPPPPVPPLEPIAFPDLR
jgi:hypothetical protein